MDVRAFGSWMSAPKCLFFSRILRALTEVLGRDIRANDARMPAGYPARKLPLWADFLFLTNNLAWQNWLGESVMILKRMAKLRSCVPHTKYKTPPNPKIHREIHPNPPPKPKYRKNTKNIRKSPNFVYFSYFFSISGLEEDLGCISRCILGFGGVLYILYGGRMIASLQGEIRRSSAPT